jgi:hypothetical protein
MGTMTSQPGRYFMFKLCVKLNNKATLLLLIATSLKVKTGKLFESIKLEEVTMLSTESENC